MLSSSFQIVKGIPGVGPSDVVIDFISAFHQFFSAGIFWINCHDPALLRASISYIESVSKA